MGNVYGDDRDGCGSTRLARNASDQVSDLERKALRGDRSAIRRLAELARGAPPQPRETDHAECIRLADDAPDEVVLEVRAARNFALVVRDDEARTTRTLLAGRGFDGTIQFDLLMLDARSSTRASRVLRVEGRPSGYDPETLELVVNGKVVLRTERP